MSPTLSNAAPFISNCPVFFKKQLSWSSFWKLIHVHFGNPVMGFLSSSKSFSLSCFNSCLWHSGPGPLLWRVTTVGTMALGFFLLPKHTPSPLLALQRNPPAHWIQCCSQRPCFRAGAGYLGARGCCYHSPKHWPWETGIQLPLLGYPKGFRLLLLRGSWNRNALKDSLSLDLLFSLYHSGIFYRKEPQRRYSCASVSPLSCSKIFSNWYFPEK